MFQVIKRDGEEAEFALAKISDAISGLKPIKSAEKWFFSHSLCYNEKKLYICQLEKWKVHCALRVECFAVTFLFSSIYVDIVGKGEEMVRRKREGKSFQKGIEK